MSDMQIAMLRKTMRGHKSAELKATLHEMQYELAGVNRAKAKYWEAWNSGDDATWQKWRDQLDPLNEDETRLCLIIDAIKEELTERWQYWHYTHADKQGFNLEARATFRG